MLKHVTSREDWNEKSVGAKGFTLIELLVVIIILGVLAAVAIFAVGNIGDKSKENACKSEKDTVATAIEAFNANTGDYPTAIGDLTTQPDGNLKTTPKYWTISADGKSPAAVGTLPTGCT